MVLLIGNCDAMPRQNRLNARKMMFCGSGFVATSGEAARERSS